MFQAVPFFMSGVLSPLKSVSASVQKAFQSTRSSLCKDCAMDSTVVAISTNDGDKSILYSFERALSDSDLESNSLEKAANVAYLRNASRVITDVSLHSGSKNVWLSEFHPLSERNSLAPARLTPAAALVAFRMSIHRPGRLWVRASWKTIYYYTSCDRPLSSELLAHYNLHRQAGCFLEKQLVIHMLEDDVRSAHIPEERGVDVCCTSSTEQRRKKDAEHPLLGLVA